MSNYQDKYLKYKNKYLALKAQISNSSEQNSMFIKNSESSSIDNMQIKINNMLGGNKIVDDESVQITDVTITDAQVKERNNKKKEEKQVKEESESSNVEEKFNSNKKGGARKAVKSTKKKNDNYKKHFLDDSDITDGSDLSSSETEFSSSDLDW
jgi:hypothetical protein